MRQSATGLIETEGLVAAIEAADCAAKAASVELIAFETIGGGFVTVRLSGDVASVQTAVSAAAEAAGRIGRVVSRHVIPAPHSGLQAAIDAGRSTGTATGVQSIDGIPTTEVLESLPVSQLRQLVRQIPGSRLKGREVSRANKDELIEELEKARKD